VLNERVAQISAVATCLQPPKPASLRLIQGLLPLAVVVLGCDFSFAHICVA